MPNISIMSLSVKNGNKKTEKNKKGALKMANSITEGESDYKPAQEGK